MRQECFKGISYQTIFLFKKLNFYNNNIKFIEKYRKNNLFFFITKIQIDILICYLIIIV